jgi:hypothetical protein
MWQITIGSLQLKNGKKHMLGVNSKNINRPFTQEWCMDIIWYISNYVIVPINSRMWQPFIYVILKSFLP